MRRNRERHTFVTAAAWALHRKEDLEDATTKFHGDWTVGTFFETVAAHIRYLCGGDYGLAQRQACCPNGVRHVISAMQARMLPSPLSLQI